MRRSIIFLLLPAIVWTACYLVGSAEQRTWRSADGQYTVEGEFIEFKDAAVVMRRSDGQVITVQLDRLSEADRQYVAAKTGGSPPPVPPAAAPLSPSPAAAGGSASKTAAA